MHLTPPNGPSWAARARLLAGAACIAASVGCVSGAKIRADAEVLRSEVERARRQGAVRCAPRELATAEANLDFAMGELNEGTSYRANQHIRDAEAAVRKALHLSRDCGPKQVLIKDADRETKPPPL